MKNKTLQLVTLFSFLTGAQAQATTDDFDLQTLHDQSPQLHRDSPCDQLLAGIRDRLDQTMATLQKSHDEDALHRAQIQANLLARSHQACRQAEVEIHESQGQKREKAIAKAKAESLKMQSAVVEILGFEGSEKQNPRSTNENGFR